MMLRAFLAALAVTLSVGVAAQPDVAKKPAAKAAAKATQPKPHVRPAWAELTAGEQQVLAPLKADWDTLEPERRQKWIAIAKRYPRMNMQEQERVQRRMQVWARLTPEQRRQARENYKQLAKSQKPAPKKDLRQAWAEYQALSPSERQSLAPSYSNDPRRQKH